MSAALAGWAVEAIAGSALLMLIVLALRAPVRAAFGPQVAYLLWLMPLARLLLPPSLLASPWPDATAPIASGATIVSVEMLPGADPAASILPLAWLFAIWAVGVLGLIVWQAAGYLRLRHGTLAAATEIARDGRIRVLRAGTDAGPLAFGTLDPVIVLPRDFAGRYDADEQALALAHERAHHARGDLHANLAALAVLALHWFNPIAWIALRAFRADQELACDARVLAANPALRHAYGTALVKAARGGALSPACHFNTVDALKRRLKMLNVKAKSRARRMIGATLASGLAAVGLVATATGTPAGAAIERAGDEVTTVLQGVEVSPVPTVPTAPIAPRAMPTPRAPSAPHALPAPHAVPAPPALPTLQALPVVPVPPVPPARVRTMRIVTRDGDGYRVMDNGFEVEAPNIDARDCAISEGDGRQHTMESGEGRKRRIVICTNRIERHAEAAAAAGIDAQRMARSSMASALASLEASRRSIARARGMSAEARAGALEGIDEAIAELRQEMADPS